NDRLEFVSPGGSRLWAGFSGPLRFFDVTDPQAAARLDAGQGGVFNETAGRRYWAIGPQGYRKPSRLALPAALDLRAAGSGADYVAIGPADLLEPLQPLLDWRSQRGLKTKAIPLEAVYDQFNYGMPEPEAIRTFLKAAAKSWQPAPHYVLLVGDATYDPRGYLSSPDANRLPTFLVSTIFGGETASDLGYAVLEGDAWPAAEDAPVPKPALAVGRMPARDPKQVADVVEKTLAYEKAAVDPVAGQAAWRKRVLAIADGQDPSFRLDAQAFLDSFQGQYQTDLYSPQAGASDANAQIRDRLGRGDLLVAYFGHGSINMWGKDRLFSNDDVKLLADSDNLPVIINMTCLVGLFTHPKVDSLAETLLWQPGGGAVAVLAATSLTLPNDQSFLSKPLAENLLGDSPISLGDLLLRARQQVPADSPGTRDVLQTFLLFGDPALTLK
ncbi:MAG TPA: C25 family cysteine peptidase, partial [Anaerolineales bacterium]